MTRANNLLTTQLISMAFIYKSYMLTNNLDFITLILLISLLICGDVCDILLLLLIGLVLFPVTWLQHSWHIEPHSVILMNTTNVWMHQCIFPLLLYTWETHTHTHTCTCLRAACSPCLSNRTMVKPCSAKMRSWHSQV